MPDRALPIRTPPNRTMPLRTTPGLARPCRSTPCLAAPNHVPPDHARPHLSSQCLAIPIARLTSVIRGERDSPIWIRIVQFFKEGDVSPLQPFREVARQSSQQIRFGHLLNLDI